MIGLDLSKQKALDSDMKTIQQINLIENLSDSNNIWMFFIIEKAKETILDFSQGTVKVLQIYITLTKYQYKMTQCNTLNIKLSNSQLTIKIWNEKWYWSNF